MLFNYSNKNEKTFHLERSLSFYDTFFYFAAQAGKRDDDGRKCHQSRVKYHTSQVTVHTPQQVTHHMSHTSSGGARARDSRLPGMWHVVWHHPNINKCFSHWGLLRAHLELMRCVRSRWRKPRWRVVTLPCSNACRTLKLRPQTSGRWCLDEHMSHVARHTPQVNKWMRDRQSQRMMSQPYYTS